jgi:hypothetical protein
VEDASFYRIAVGSLPEELEQSGLLFLCSVQVAEVAQRRFDARWSPPRDVLDVARAGDDELVETSGLRMTGGSPEYRRHALPLYAHDHGYLFLSVTFSGA